jgi:hypothetical protein
MKELFAALVKAQSEMGGAVKDSANPFFKSKYADLSSVMEAIRPAFAAHGLGFIQIVHDAEGAACIETIIIHESGQEFHCGKVSVPVSKNDAQGYGSAITYAKRYSLQAAVGVPSIDDDGNAAVKAAPPEKAQKPAKLYSPPLIEPGKYRIENPERADMFFTAAKLAIGHHVAGDNEAAFDEVSGITDNDEKQYLWAILRDYSALRQALKDIKDARHLKFMMEQKKVAA